VQKRKPPKSKEVSLCGWGRPPWASTHVTNRRAFIRLLGNGGEGGTLCVVGISYHNMPRRFIAPRMSYISIGRSCCSVTERTSSINSPTGADTPTGIESTQKLWEMCVLYPSPYTRTFRLNRRSFSSISPLNHRQDRCKLSSKTARAKFHTNKNNGDKSV